MGGGVTKGGCAIMTGKDCVGAAGTIEGTACGDVVHGFWCRVRLRRGGSGG